MNLYIKTKTPNNENEKELTKHYFNPADKDFQTGMFRSPYGQDQKENTRSVEKFVEDLGHIQTRNTPVKSVENQPFVEIKFAQNNNFEMDNSSNNI